MGVNDAWAEIDTGNGVSPENYEKYLSLIIDEVKAALPDIKLMILEPFVLKYLILPDKYAELRVAVEAIAKAAKRTAEKYNIKFVPLMKNLIMH